MPDEATRNKCNQALLAMSGIAHNHTATDSQHQHGDRVQIHPLTVHCVVRGRVRTLSISSIHGAVCFVEHHHVRPVEPIHDPEEKRPLRHGVVGRARHIRPRVRTVHQTAGARHQRHPVDRGQFAGGNQVICTGRSQQKIHWIIQRLDSFIQARHRVLHATVLVQTEILFNFQS